MERKLHCLCSCCNKLAAAKSRLLRQTAGMVATLWRRCTLREVAGLTKAAPACGARMLNARAHCERPQEKESRENAVAGSDHVPRHLAVPVTVRARGEARDQAGESFRPYREVSRRHRSAPPA